MNTFRGIAVSTLLVLWSVGCATSSVSTLERPVYLIDCNDVGNYASTSGDEQFVVEFLNSRDSILDMYWINYEGEEVFKTSISPGETWSRNTYVIHPWVVRERSGLCVAAYHSVSSVLVEI